LQSFHKTGSVGSAGDQKIGSTKLCWSTAKPIAKAVLRLVCTNFV
jgi:hypothetical protein